MTTDPLSLFVLISCAAWLWLVWRGHRIINYLTDLSAAPTRPDRGTTVSVVVTACDEEDTIGPAMHTLLEQDLPGLEFIAINDRSVDKTGAILDALAAEDDRLKVSHIEVLPDGWLGKVHAMQRGVDIATGDWILFSDADVHFSSEVIGRAVAEAEIEELDHLTLIPHTESGSILLDVLVVAFAKMLFLAIRVGTGAQRPLGVGAFNLVRRSALEQSSGLEWLRMEVADDTGLAMIIADAGGQTDFRMATDALRIQWYPSTRAMFRGLEKNAYLLMSQGTPLRFLGPIGLFLALIGAPLIGVVVQPSAAAFVASIVAPLLFIAMTFKMRTRIGARRWLALFAPLGPALMCAVGLWSMVQTLRRGGINWRGTYYPLDQLIAGQRVKL